MQVHGETLVMLTTEDSDRDVVCYLVIPAHLFKGGPLDTPR